VLWKAVPMLRTGFMSGAKQRIVHIFVLLIALSGSACGGQPKPVAKTTDIESIRVAVVAPISRVLYNDEFYLDNCSGDSEVRRPLASIAQVEKSVALAAEATATTTGTTAAIPEELKAKLLTQIELVYQETLDTARSNLEQTEMVAGAHTRFTFTIIWEEQEFASTVSFAMNGITYTAPYTYTLHIPRLGSAKPGICSG
jgi:hypothetical protein